MRQAMKSHIPSVDEIRSGASAQPVAAPIGRMVTAEHDISAIKRKIEALRRGKKLTPAQIREGMDLLMQQYDYSPVESLIMTRLATSDERLGMQIDMFLTKFMVPELKSVEVSGSVDHVHTVVVRRYGVDGKVSDAPLRVPGLPAPMQDLARPVERIIDAEVTNA